MDQSNLFWERLNELVSTCPLIIDRPAGSAHPRYPDLIYPLDYGYLQGTQAIDGGGIDVWAGSAPDRVLTGLVFTVDLTKRDAEVKLLLGCTPTEIEIILQVHNSGSQSGIVLFRPAA